MSSQTRGTIGLVLVILGGVALVGVALYALVRWLRSRQAAQTAQVAAWAETTRLGGTADDLRVCVDDLMSRDATAQRLSSALLESERKLRDEVAAHNADVRLLSDAVRDRGRMIRDEAEGRDADVKRLTSLLTDRERQLARCRSEAAAAAV